MGRKPLIIDVGMHVGQDTAFYLAKGFRVVAIEADPALVEQRRASFAEAIGAGDLEIVHAAVAGEEGEIDFFVNAQQREWSSIHRGPAGREGHSVETVRVPAVLFDDVLARVGEAHYVKIDIEHADHLALEAIVRCERKPRYVSAEATGFEAAALMYTAGYREFKLINQARAHRWELPDPPLEGRYVEHKFELHSSGPFGEETPGEWLGLDRFVEEWVAVRRLMELNAEIFSAWFDVHARLP